MCQETSARFCNGYFKAIEAFKKPLDGIDWLRDEAAKSWGTIFFGTIFTKLCYLALLPFYLGMTIFFGLLNAVTFPILTPIQCCVGRSDDEHPETRVLDIFSIPAQGAMLQTGRIFGALFSCP